MCRKEIVSYNIAAWRWRLSEEKYESRLTRNCEFIKKNAPQAFIIGLQEIIIGPKYYTLLKKHFPEYKIVLPIGYDLEKNKKSAISILLINTEGLESFSVRELSGLKEGSARYNFVTINTKFGCYRVLHVNIPQTMFLHNNTAEWYKKNRIKLKDDFKKVILEEATTYRDEKDVKFMLLGDMNSNTDDAFIVALANNYNQPIYEPLIPENKNKATWRNKVVNCEGCLDHIYYSMGMMKAEDVRIHYTNIIEESIQEELSDHTLLIGSFDASCIDEI